MASKIEIAEHIKYLEPNPNADHPSEMTVQLTRASFVGPPTLEQPRHLASPSLDANAAHASFQNAIPEELIPTASQQMTYERKPGPNGLSSQPTGEPRRVRKTIVAKVRLSTVKCSWRLIRLLEKLRGRSLNDSCWYRLLRK